MSEPLALPEPLTKCPIRDDCTSKNLFRLPDGQVMQYSLKLKAFKEHICTDYQAHSADSIKPTEGWLAEWYNKRTGKTRWVGPARLKRSVRRPPPDNKYRVRKADNHWELRGLYNTSFNWKKLPRSEWDNK